VEELAEVLAVDFEDAEGTAKLNPSWRWEDHEQALLSSCSSLITIVENVAMDSDNTEIQNDGSLVVQFSHFSAKEFLTSPRLASPNRNVSHYHIILEPAHTIMAQACLAVLLRLDDGVGKNDTGNSSPLVRYAAKHWVAHAQFRSVSSQIRNAMECLFDPERPYFAAWLRWYDMDTLNYIPPFVFFVTYKESDGTPLYYAALCGFQDLVEHLIAKCPDHAKAIGGYYQTAAVAALTRRHFELARLLHRHGSSLDPPGTLRQTPLSSASMSGDLEMVQVLLDNDADVNSRNEYGSSSLIVASDYVGPQTLHIVRLLLHNGANPNVWTSIWGTTPLHAASYRGNLEVVRLLLEYGADVERKNKEDRTPFEVALEGRHHEVALFLSFHGARHI
jgi:hypothetical protein